MSINKKITMIFATSDEGLFGDGDGLPWNLKSDLAFFKMVTTGGVLIVGSKTYLGLPPLVGRDMIVLTKEPTLEMLEKRAADLCKIGEHSILFNNNLEEALDMVFSETLLDKPVFIIGGAKVLIAALPYATDIIHTVIPDKYVLVKENEDQTYLPTSFFISIGKDFTNYATRYFDETDNEVCANYYSLTNEGATQ